MKGTEDELVHIGGAWHVGMPLAFSHACKQPLLDTVIMHVLHLLCCCMDPCWQTVRRYEVYTISRPAHPLSVVSYPLVRFYQEKFGTDSAAAVVAALAQPVAQRQ